MRVGGLRARRRARPSLHRGPGAAAARAFGAFACAALVLAASPGRAAAQDNGGLIEIVDISFEGNDQFASDTLKRAIYNRETTCRSFIFALFCALDLDFADDRRYLEPRQLPNDVQRLRVYYYQRGFREAQIDTVIGRPEPDEMEITFVIDEGRPVLVDSLELVGLEAVEPEVYRDLPIAEGDPLSAILIQATRDSLTVRLRNRGYAYADVLNAFSIPRETPYAARVTFDVATGPLSRFGEITVANNEQLSDDFVRSRLPFDEGDVYSREDVLAGQRALYSLELISAATIDDGLPDALGLDDAGMPLDPDSIIPVTVTINEAQVHRVRTGVGGSTADCLNAEARWVSRNFFGDARRLQVLGRVSNVLASSLGDTPLCGEAGTGDFARLNWLLSVDFNQPWFFGSRNSLSASIFAERQSLPDVFIRRAFGFNVGVTRLLSRGTPVSVGYRPTLSKLEAAEIFFCTSFLVCTREDVDALQEDNWLSPVSLTLSRDRTDNLLNPTEGYSAILSLEHASGLTGSDFSYDRAIVEGAYYRPYAQRTVLAARLRLGWVGAGEFLELSASSPGEIVHPQKRFYAGGANSVRGFPQNRLGPRVVTASVADLIGPTPDGDTLAAPKCTPFEIVALTCDAGALGDEFFQPRPVGGTRLLEGSVEYRFAFGGQFQGAFFVDFGQVWREEETVAITDVELSPGLGVRYFSVIGPIRVDVGYRFRGAEELQLVTSQIRPFVPGVDAPDAEARVRIRQEGTDELLPIDWVRIDELAVLDPRIVYGERGGFFDTLFRSIQLHFSIGQAF